MQKNYKVIWADTAEQDLYKILEYIAQNNPDNALKILKKIKKQVAELHFSPEKCRIIPELYDHGITQYREMIVSPWRLCIELPYQQYLFCRYLIRDKILKIFYLNDILNILVEK